MLVSAVGPQNPITATIPKHNHHHLASSSSLSLLKPPTLPVHLAASTPLSLRHVSTEPDPPPRPPGGEEEEELVPSSSAVALAIRRSSTSPVEFVQRVEPAGGGGGSKLVLPSPDFQRLCSQQLALFRRIVHPRALLSVYVRPAGSYVMDRLELRRVMCYPGENAVADVVMLVGSFGVPAGMRAAEATLSSQQVQFVPEHRAIVLPMVKHPFVIGFLVAELPVMEMQKPCLDLPNKGRNGEQDLISSPPSPEETFDLRVRADKKLWSIQTLHDETPKMHNFSSDQRMSAIDITNSLAMAYVMDQKAMLLQQSSWQNNVRMNTLVEQIRGPLSSIRTLSKLLSTHVKRNEISSDIVDDILVQGNRISDTLQELQDAVYLTKTNIMRFNEETLKRINTSSYAYAESARSHLSDNSPRDPHYRLHSSDPLSSSISAKDLEMPMPPSALAPLQLGIRPCNVSDILAELVGAVRPLARMQQRSVELNEPSHPLQVAVEEPSLRQALSNIIEGALLRTHVGGRVEIVSTSAPAGGALVVIDDDGPDMHYMTQMRSLTPFGAELLAENMIEDNMAWNFVAGITVAREILESYGCVVRVVSPRTTDAVVGTGGTRIELWLPSFATSSDATGPLP